MTLVREENEAFYPGEVRFFGASDIMFGAQGLTNLVE
jgi:hypothetical protein